MLKDETLDKIKPGTTISIQDKYGNFKGVVLARKHGKEKGATFTVRATVGGVDVEKVYPLYSPNLLKVKILSTPKKVRRSKLYFLRNLSRKKSRRKIGASA